MVHYRIVIKEEISRDWSSWFDGWQMDIDEKQQTILSGDIQDQTALHGVLAKIRDLRLTLVSIQSDASGDTTP